MKKLIGFYILFLITVYLLAGCGTKKNQPEDNSEMMKENNMESSDMMEENDGDQMEMMDTTEMKQETMK